MRRFAWRRENSVDTILSRPHPLLGRVQGNVSALFLLPAISGGHVVFVQRPGLIDFELGYGNNLTMEELLDHYVYSLEYCWNLLEPRPDQTMTNVVDMTGPQHGGHGTRRPPGLLQKVHTGPERALPPAVLQDPGRLHPPLVRDRVQNVCPAPPGIHPRQNRNLFPWTQTRPSPRKIPGQGQRPRRTQIVLPQEPTKKEQEQQQEEEKTRRDTNRGCGNPRTKLRIGTAAFGVCKWTAGVFVGFFVGFVHLCFLRSRSFPFNSAKPVYKRRGKK